MLRAFRAADARGSGGADDEEIYVDRPTPIGLAYQHNGDWLDLARLYQSQNLEQLVERAITTRKRDQRLCPQQERESPLYWFTGPAGEMSHLGTILQVALSL
jgi:hypothetical protein